MRQLAARRRLSPRNVLACGLTRLSPVLPLQNRAFFSLLCGFLGKVGAGRRDTALLVGREGQLNSP